MRREQQVPRSGAVERGEEGGFRGDAMKRWLPWIALAYLLAGGLFVAWAKMDTTQLTIEVHQLRAEAAELQQEQMRLQARLAQLQTPSYLAAKALELGLEEPEPADVVRVAQSE